MDHNHFLAVTDCCLVVDSNHVIIWWRKNLEWFCLVVLLFSSQVVLVSFFIWWIFLFDNFLCFYFLLYIPFVRLLGYFLFPCFCGPLFFIFLLLYGFLINRQCCHLISAECVIFIFCFAQICSIFGVFVFSLLNQIIFHYSVLLFCFVFVDLFLKDE